LFNIGLLTFIPFLTLFISESVYRGSLGNTLFWLTHYPNQFLVCYAIIFGLINIFYFLPRRVYVTLGVLFVSLFSIFGFISRQKLVLRGEPLLPWDFKLGKEALNISQSFEGLPMGPLIPLILIAILAAAILIGFLFIPKEKYLAPQKILTAVLALALFFSLTEYIPLQKTFSLRLINWSQKSNYEENGMLLGFLLNSKYLSVAEPGDYQSRTVEDILGRSNPSYPVDPDFTPNIIFVMSEAFWDPTVLEGISYSEDPLPYFHSLQQKHTQGIMLAPVYGGGTANTEFEVLTGLSTHFLPQGIIPYVQFVHKPLEALPTIFKRQGYEATAIHTYDNWFYRRNLVYQDLGFDKFISKEFFINPEYSGPYIRDTELSRRVLQVLQQTSKPDFIYAVSMQAHGPYSSEENPENSIKIDGDLNPTTKTILENYTNIIADVDESLRLLIKGLEELGEPSLVVFFGDHLPMLGKDFDVYKEAGFFQGEDSYPEYLNKYSLPFIVWDNFSHTKEDLRLSSSFLGSYILEHSKKEGSPLTDFLHTLNAKGANVITGTHYLPYEKMNEEEFSQYRLLQYDFLIGNEYAYSLKPLNKPGINPVYTLGDCPATIEEVLIPDHDTLKVLGMNFSQNHQIYVNDQPLATEFIDDTLLTATLPKAYLDKSEPIEIQVKLTDSMKNVIFESNIYLNS
jgi:phosphoglycerol transferase MdoB-like AlkP superfamily enzyme